MTAPSEAQDGHDHPIEFFMHDGKVWVDAVAFSEAVVCEVEGLDPGSAFAPGATSLAMWITEQVQSMTIEAIAKQIETHEGSLEEALDRIFGEN